MSLRARTIFIIALIFVSLVTSIYVLFSAILVRQFMDIEENSLNGDLSRVEAALDNTIGQLVASTTDWAQWDATYQYMLDRNDEYVSTNYTLETLSAVSVERLVFFGKDSTPILELQVPDGAGNLIQKKGEFSPFVSDLRAVLPVANAVAHSEGLLREGSSVLMFAAVPIVDSKREKGVEGFLVRTFKISQDFFESLAKQTRLNMKASVVPETDSGRRELAQPSIERLSDSIIVGRHQINDRNNKGALIFTVQKPRIIYEQGIRTRDWLLALLLISAIATLSIAYFVINRWLLSRFISLGQQLDEVRSSPNAAGRISEVGNDEIGALGKDINLVLDALNIARSTAERATIAKTMLMSQVSHELRNPVGAMLGINYIIKKSADLPRAVRDLLEMSDTTANGLIDILSDFLDYSKAEAGELRLEKIPFDIRQVVRKSMQITAGRLAHAEGEQKPVELVCEVDANVPDSLIGDPTRLRQVFVNLLSNALKFTKSGYVGLKMEMAPSTSGACVLQAQVWDTGIGIAANKLETIFEPFKQADESVARVYQGTGLGLAIVRQFVRVFGGTIEVQSEVGKGTQFKVTIPLGFDPTTAGHKPRQIGALVAVGDDSLVFNSLVHGLSGYGDVQVVHPHELDAADRIARADNLVVTEIGFTHASLEAAVRARNDEKKKQTVAVVSPANIALREQLYTFGLSHVLSTPVLAGDVVACLAGDTPEQVVVAPAPTSTDLKSLGKLHIALADDTLANRMIIADMLNDAGQDDVTEVVNGQELVDLLRGSLASDSGTKPFHIALTDITMPVMDGDTATRKIREIEREQGGGARIPIIAITAHALQSEQQRILDAGVDEIIIKPVTLESFGGCD